MGSNIYTKSHVSIFTLISSRLQVYEETEVDASHTVNEESIARIVAPSGRSAVQAADPTPVSHQPSGLSAAKVAGSQMNERGEKRSMPAGPCVQFVEIRALFCKLKITCW